MQLNCTFVASAFVIQPQIWIFSVFKNSKSFHILIANEKLYVTVFYLFTFAINLWHRKFVTTDVTAVSVNTQQSTWHSSTRTRFW